MRFIALGCLVGLVGCTIVADTFVADGSRADGRVVMTTSTTTQTIGEVDWREGIRQAELACLEWGYSAGRPFEGVTTQSQMTRNALGQATFAYTYQRIYQCTINEVPR